jgi:hypothetical protein
VNRTAVAKLSRSQEFFVNLTTQRAIAAVAQSVQQRRVMPKLAERGRNPVLATIRRLITVDAVTHQIHSTVLGLRLSDEIIGWRRNN